MALTQDITTSADAMVACRLEEITERLGVELLFLSPRGSRLYGLSNAQSDFDYFAVTTKVKTKKANYAKQTIDGKYDIVLMDLGTFSEYARKGVPENLEAMFSQKAEYDTISFIRNNYVSGTTATDTYLRTIKSFCYDGSYKRKRHALRLALNLHDLQRHGRFNPTLSPNEVDFVSDRADRDSDAVYATAMNIALDKMPPGMLR